MDRAALDAGIRLGLDIGGWCPMGRLAEDGAINSIYPLLETPGIDYAVRTKWNVRDSDGTLILHRGELHGGTALTRVSAIEYGRPFLCYELRIDTHSPPVLDWIKTKRIQTLNVAGPRESSSPGIYDLASAFLIELLRKQ